MVTPKKSGKKVNKKDLQKEKVVQILFKKEYSSSILHVLTNNGRIFRLDRYNSKQKPIWEEIEAPDFSCTK